MLRISQRRARARQVSHSQAATTQSESPRKGTCSTQFLHHSLTCSISRQVTIGSLSNEVLLNIFRYYLDVSPRFWPRLVQICRKWRQIIFAPQQARALQLRLFCTHETPILKTLDCWPALPIVVEYGGLPALDPPTPKDQANIIAALKHPDRVTSISLTVTNSLLRTLSAIERPFSELEDLVLLFRHTARLTLPSAFRWGLRLRTLHLTGAADPALPGLLFPSTGLVDLQLNNIPKDGYFTPEAFVNALSGMTQLRTLSLHFLSFTPHRKPLGLPPQLGDRVVLPALTCLKYRGTSMYLEGLVARIDAPRLGGIGIALFCRPKMDASQLGRFINRIGMHKLHSRAEIISSERTSSISFTQPEVPTRLELQVSCKSLDRQSSYMAKICKSLSAFLLGVEHLRISGAQPSSGHDNSDRSDRRAWPKLIRPFKGTKWVHLAGDHSTSIVCALRSRQSGVLLPTLHKLCVREPEPHYAPLEEAVVSLIRSRQLSGHMIGVEYERFRINELHGTGTTFAQCQLYHALIWS